MHLSVLGRALTWRRMHSWMGYTAGLNHNPKESEAEMPPEALLAHPSLCGMNTETQREGWPSEGSEAPSIGHTSSHLPPASGSTDPWPRPDHPGKEVPWLPTWEHHRLPACESGMWAVDPGPPPAQMLEFPGCCCVFTLQSPPPRLVKCRRGKHSVLSSDWKWADDHSW